MFLLKKNSNFFFIFVVIEGLLCMVNDHIKRFIHLMNKLKNLRCMYVPSSLLTLRVSK